MWDSSVCLLTSNQCDGSSIICTPGHVILKARGRSTFRNFISEEVGYLWFVGVVLPAQQFKFEATPIRTAQHKSLIVAADFKLVVQHKCCQYGHGSVGHVEHIDVVVPIQRRRHTG